MDKTKNNIIMDRFLLKSAIKLEEERKGTDYFYSQYHARLASDYFNILCDLEDFVGYDSFNQDKDSNDFVSFVSKATFDCEKPEETFRKKYNNPMYLRALGETASYYYRKKINAIIESKILPDKPKNPALENLYYDGIHAYEEPFYCQYLPVIDIINNKQLEFSINRKTSKYEIILVKSEEQLEFEQAYLMSAFMKLANEATDEDTKKTYKRYARYISYIYEYYISISSGKQLSVPRLSDNNLKTIDSNTRYTKAQLLSQITSNNKTLLGYFKDLQKKNNEPLEKIRSYKL